MAASIEVNLHDLNLQVLEVQLKYFRISTRIFNP